MIKFSASITLLICGIAASACSTRAHEVGNAARYSLKEGERAALIAEALETYEPEEYLRLSVISETAPYSRHIDLADRTATDVSVCGTARGEVETQCIDIENVRSVSRLESEIDDGVTTLLLLPAIPIFMLLNPRAIAMGGG